MNPRVKVLASRTLHPQKSPEWFKQRHTRITASEAASCLFKTPGDCGSYMHDFNSSSVKLNGKGMNSWKSREEYIISKCLEFYGVSQYTDTHSTLHGKRFEDVASKLYCNLRGCTVIEFGLLEHDTLPWLGASPDGITKDGVMLEIKCPNVRKIKPNEFPIYYWVQMQIQLEVCDLEECDYIECNVKEINEVDFYDVPADKYPGIILRHPGTEKYIYSPLDVVTVEDHIVWLATQDQSLECVFYYIENYQILNVKRDKTWFNHVKPKLKETFDVVANFQNNKDEWDVHYTEYTRAKNSKHDSFFDNSVCLIDDVGEYIVDDDKTECVFTESVCLID